MGTSRKPWRGNLHPDTETLSTHSHNLKQIQEGRGGEVCNSYSVFKQTALPINDWCFWQCWWCKTQSTEVDGHVQAACREWPEILCPLNEKWKREVESAEGLQCDTCTCNKHSEILFEAKPRLTWMRIFPKQTDGVLSSAMNIIPWK